MRKSLLTFIVAAALPISAFAANVRVPEACEAMLYRDINQQLPANQFVSSLYVNDEHPGSLIDMTISQDLGNQNYCLKGGLVTVQYNGDECTVIDVAVDPGNFDCG